MLNTAHRKMVGVVAQTREPSETAQAHRPSAGGPRLVVSNDDTDALLVRAALDGERLAFQRLVERHLGRSVGTARRLLGNAANAEDVTQEAFVRLWNRLSDLEVGVAGVWPWLRRVIFNLCMDRIRARRDNDPDALDYMVSDSDQQRDLEALDTAVRVDAALKDLPDRQGAAIALFHYEGYSVKEIAETMDSSADAIESLLGRARRTLKKALKDEWRELLPGDMASEGTASNAEE